MTTPAGLLHLTRSIAATALLSLGLVACAGDDSAGTDTDDASASATQTTTSDSATASSTSDSASGSTSDGTGGSSGGAEVDYEADVQVIWNNRCTAGCHTTEGMSPTMPLMPLDAGASYNNIVDVMSTQVVSMKVVAPGSTNDSYLWHKVNDTHLEVGGSGSRMPLVALPADEVATIEAWIKGGAKP